MKKLIYFAVIIGLMAFMAYQCGCDSSKPENKTAKDEQAATEINQAQLFVNQPPPRITWSLERDNLIKRFQLMNDRDVMFYMYVFVPGVQDPIGYYQINKVSSVNSQLTNTEQIVRGYGMGYENNQFTLPSPAEDGSYGTNGDAVFGFTPDQIYIEHNMLYICATVPLSFTKPVNRLTIIDVKTAGDLKKLMDKFK